MKTVPYTTKSGATQFRPVFDHETEALLSSDESIGICLGCGVEAYGVEPDARKYVCESCGKPKVYGLQETLIMGLLR